MMRVLKTTSLLLAVFAAGSALAQKGNSGGMSPGTPRDQAGAPVGTDVNNVDKLFVRLVGIGGHAEVDAGTAGKKKATSDAIKDFANRMVDDHSKANLRLEDAAKKAGIVVPDAPDAEHKGTHNHLDQVTGHQFDVDYLNAQIADHAKTAQLLAWEIDNGQNAGLQHFASETLPVVLQHLQDARGLMAELNTQGSKEKSKPASQH